MKRTKTNKGITLIALIITIVVLLILAAVAISSIQNDGILHYAQNAASGYNQAQTNEVGIIGGYGEFLNSHVPGNSNEDEELAPGLYQTGTSTMIYSWDELISEGIIVLEDSGNEDGTYMIMDSNRSELIGDLILHDSVMAIEMESFYGCTTITGLICNDNSKLLVIKSAAFMGCSNLENVILSDRMEFFQDGAFGECYNLKSVSFGISENFAGFDSGVFYSCTSLTEVNFKGTIARWDSIGFDYNVELPNCTINCTDGVITPQASE